RLSRSHAKLLNLGQCSSRYKPSVQTGELQCSSPVCSQRENERSATPTVFLQCQRRARCETLRDALAVTPEANKEALRRPTSDVGWRGNIMKDAPITPFPCSASSRMHPPRSTLSEWRPAERKLVGAAVYCAGARCKQCGATGGPYRSGRHGAP
ncbi:hypothetical protein HPB47_012575, partial [Ixodes persulcatus]